MRKFISNDWKFIWLIVIGRAVLSGKSWESLFYKNKASFSPEDASSLLNLSIQIKTIKINFFLIWYAIVDSHPHKSCFLYSSFLLLFLFFFVCYINVMPSSKIVMVFFLSLLLNRRWKKFVYFMFLIMLSWNIAFFKTTIWYSCVIIQTYHEKSINPINVVATTTRLSIFHSSLLSFLSFLILSRFGSFTLFYCVHFSL